MNYEGLPALLRLIVDWAGKLMWPAAIMLASRPGVGNLSWSPIYEFSRSHPYLAVGLTIIAPFAVWTGLALAVWTLFNVARGLVLLAAFPFRLVLSIGRTLRSNRRVMDQFQLVLEPWIAQDAVLRIYDEALRCYASTDWEDLTPDQILGRLIVATGFLQTLPRTAWTDLANRDLGAQAISSLFRAAGEAKPVVRKVLAALVARNAFTDTALAPDLVREMAALPAPRLTFVLKTVGELDKLTYGQTVHIILVQAQLLSEQEMVPFVEAIPFMPVELCRAVLQCAHSASHPDC